MATNIAPARLGNRLVLVWVLTVAALAGTTVPASATRVAQVTAEAQLQWVVDASARVPIPAAEQRQHLSSSFLDAIGGTDNFNAVLGQLGPLALQELLVRTPARVQAITGSAQGLLLVTLAVDAAGLVEFLLFLPAPPRSWAELDARLHALAPRVSFAASVIDTSGHCRPLHAVDAGTTQPLGSAFKLYVLGALARAVTDGRVSWDEQLAIREEWKSMPSGVLQDAPAGTMLPLREYANYMISISDNTATDHLIHLLGREAVQRQLFRFDNDAAISNIPFLTTRELFALKGFRYPTIADGYLALPRPLRAHALPLIGQIPRSEIKPWTQPRKIDQIEWFGSPRDMCRAYAGLWQQNAQPGLAPVGAALSINDGGIGLDRARYPVVWFKGGSEPGVLTSNHLALTADGQVLVTSIMLANPAAPFDHATVLNELSAIARGGIELADEEV